MDGGGAGAAEKSALTPWAGPQVCAGWRAPFLLTLTQLVPQPSQPGASGWSSKLKPTLTSWVSTAPGQREGDAWLGSEGVPQGRLTSFLPQAVWAHRPPRCGAEVCGAGAGVWEPPASPSRPPGVCSPLPRLTRARAQSYFYL